MGASNMGPWEMFTIIDKYYVFRLLIILFAAFAVWEKIELKWGARNDKNNASVKK